MSLRGAVIYFDQEEDIYEAHIRVHRLGFGCQFFSVVQAVSTCAVPGEPFNFTIDLTGDVVNQLTFT